MSSIDVPLPHGQPADAPSAPPSHRSPHYRRAVALGLLVLAGIIIGSGARKVPTGPACGSSLHKPNNGGRDTVAAASHREVDAMMASARRGPALPAALAAPSASFRVGTFNIDGGQGTDGRVDLHRTAEVLRGCDLVGLMEVHGRGLREPRNQANILGDELGMPWVYLPVERRWWHDAFGNALLCRLPVTHWECWPLSPPGVSGNRNVTLAWVMVGGRKVNVLVTHVGRHEEQADELRQVLGLFQSLATPAVMMGDLNVTASEPILKRFLQDGDATDVVDRVPGQTPLSHLDWIFVRGLDCGKVGVVGKGASDHPFYWADLIVPPSPQGKVP